MRLAARYVASGIIIMVTLVTYEFYIYYGSTKSLFGSTDETRSSLLVNRKKLIPSRHNAQNISNIIKIEGNQQFISDKIHVSQSHKSSVVNQSVTNATLKTSPNLMISAEEFRRGSKIKTGNPLIDEYGNNDPMRNGEYGRGLTFVGEEKRAVQQSIDKFQVNVLASDLIPLNRRVPDSRPPKCPQIPYVKSLPTTSIIIPFYDEWPSVLYRTVYSIINRTPRHLLQEIILVDDASDLEQLKQPLQDYIDHNFPRGLVKLIRLPERVGLIAARLRGWKESSGKVLVFFDSHMEVNYDWLQPLLTEIKKDRKTVAMGVLDYISSETFEYKFNEGYMTRYGFDWRIVFFETFFRNDQIGPSEESTRVGTVMVGAAYAIDKEYFGEIGAYDEGMKVWGGENLEMAWRVWQCGGRLVHCPCSHLGHIARTQPYSFPGGRRQIEVYNYKRAIEVWMEPNHKEFVYNHFEEMKDLDPGDLSARFALKERLHCKNFTWFIDTIWPELIVYDKDVFAWGSARNLNTNKCLDNHQYLFQAQENIFAEECHYKLATQGFSWTKQKLLRTSLQCVVLKEEFDGARPLLEDCIIGPRDTWLHNQGGFIQHEKTGLCLDLDPMGPIMRLCRREAVTQMWQFNTYVY